MIERILVVADSHGSHDTLNAIVEQEKPFSHLVHCGDGVGDLYHVNLPEGTVIITVEGNMDAGRVTGHESMTMEDIGRRRIMVTHGHEYYVKDGVSELARHGHELGAEIIFFGHTHAQMLRQDHAVLFNPGPASRGYYGVVELNGSARYYLRRLPEGDVTA